MALSVFNLVEVLELRTWGPCLLSIEEGLLALIDLVSEWILSQTWWHHALRIHVCLSHLWVRHGRSRHSALLHGGIVLGKQASSILHVNIVNQALAWCHTVR